MTVPPFKRINWTEDEVVLALDLYLQAGALDDNDSRVIELSDLLRELPLHPPEYTENLKFRNPNGVSLKLENLRSLDPEYDGVAMSNASKTDRRVFDALHSDPVQVAAIASAIRDNRDAISRVPEADESDPEFSVAEGRLLYRRHRARERNPSVRAKKIAQVLDDGDTLACEVCGTVFEHFYGSIGKGYIEVHHRLPLSTGVRTTRLEDLALLCPNCHRMVHRGTGTSVEDLHRMVETRNSV